MWWVKLITVPNMIVFYLIITLLMTIAGIVRMRVTIRHAADHKLGKNRIMELVRQGRWKQLPLYSFNEIREKKNRGDVRLSVFPADEQKSKKYVLICPGGGYAHLCTDTEGYPIAAEMNELGYTAFVLEYRTGFAAGQGAPMHDLARAVQFITEHADEFGVDANDYALVGFSAGGNLIGLYGTEQFGYAQYHTPKPGAIIMGYPWTNINHWLDHPYWNIWKGLIGVYFTERGNIFLFGRHQNRERRDSVCVQKWITPNYPPTYMFSGAVDVLTPASAHADVMADALEENHIHCLYRKYFRLPHGIGLGRHTQAQHWPEEATQFWEEQCSGEN